MPSAGSDPIFGVYAHELLGICNPFAKPQILGHGSALWNFYEIWPLEKGHAPTSRPVCQGEAKAFEAVC